MSTKQTAEFHARLVQRRVNELLGGDATIRELVALMVEIGWQPPEGPREVNAANVLGAERVIAGCPVHNKGGCHR